MILVGLPAYNEAGGIEDLLLNIKKSLERHGFEYKIVVYNDGSSDATVAKILSLRDHGIEVHLIECKVNKGLGYALSHLIEYCINISSLEDAIVIMDADNTHNPEHIYHLFNYLKDGFDVVIASRYTPYSRIRGVNPYRQFLSFAASLIFKLTFPIKGVWDYSCSYRAYTAKILKMAKEIYQDKLIEERSFACMPEILIKLRRLDIIACEVPLILRYDKKLGTSKMDITLTILRSLRLILKLLFLPKLPYKKIKEFKARYRI